MGRRLMSNILRGDVCGSSDDEGASPPGGGSDHVYGIATSAVPSALYFSARTPGSTVFLPMSFRASSAICAAVSLVVPRFRGQVATLLQTRAFLKQPARVDTEGFSPDYLTISYGQLWMPPRSYIFA